MDHKRAQILEGVVVEPLKVFTDERGELRHMLRSDSPLFKKFGEVYFSFVNPGFIKGWKKHQKMTQHFTVPVGNLKLVLYDDRAKSSTHGKVQELEIGIKNYQIVSIPPQVWYAFTPI